MAAGLGTRMRSATPKHLHPLLGRRMVDWVLGGRRAAGRRPARRRRVAGDGGRVRRARPSVAVQEQPLRHRRRGRVGARRRSTVSTGDVLVLSRRHAAAHRRASAQALVEGHEPRRRRAPSSRSCSKTRASTDASSATARTARSAAIVEDGDACAERARRSARSTGRSTSSRPRSSWQALERLEPQNAQGELYLTDCVRHIVEAGEPARRTSGCPTARAALGVNTRVELAIAGGRLAGAHQRGAHARGRDDRRSGIDLDRGRRGARARRHDPPVHA